MVKYTLFPRTAGRIFPEVRVAALLIEHLRYAGLYLILFGAGLGLPVPEEVPVVLAGLLSRAQIFRWWLALPVCVVGVLSGDVVLYWLGHHWGEQVLDWRPVRCVLTREREARLLAAYRQHGVKIIFGARHVMGLRAAAFLTAGIAHIPFWKFLGVDAAAACLGLPVSFGLAYVFADRVQSVLADVHRVERWLALTAVAAVAAWLAVWAYRRGRRA
jgi:membrane protein DedA with SNARE-associated domain